MLSLASTWLLIKYQTWHSRFSADHDLQGVQKFHQESVPRIGGVCLLLAIAAGLLIIDKLLILLVLLPVFIGGIAEDLSKKVPPRHRLLAAFASGLVAVYTLDLSLVSIGWAWFDANILTVEIISTVFTVFMIGGVAHGANIIDGFNGLLLGHSLLVLGIFLVVALQVADPLVVSLVLILGGSILGLLAFNFPKGKIFSGDGGAYTVGALLAIIALLLAKNPTVSPWFCLLLLAHPVVETFFSMYRRKIVRKVSPSVPDAIHFHTLIYKRITPQVFGFNQHGYRRNAATSILLWIFVLPFMLPAIWWWDSDPIMLGTFIAFCFYYIWCYFAIVRFNIHKVIRKKV